MKSEIFAVIPAYNEEANIRKIINETKKYISNIIVVNDGSKDDIESAIKKYQRTFGSKLSYYEQKNQGANRARIRGAGLAKGEYLIFCDADIVMEPRMLELMLKALEDNPEFGFCYSSFLWGKKKFILWPYDAEKLKKVPYINTASLIRKKYFPGFDEKLKRFQDWDLWLTMSKQGRSGIWLNQILYKVNITSCMNHY